MKAIMHQKYGSPDVLHLVEAEAPVPQEHEVVMRLYATTATAVDCAFRQGNPPVARLFTGLMRPKRPILGSVVAGEITAVGSKVSRFKPGDRVYGEGHSTYAEYACLPESAGLMILPADVRYEEAAAIPYGALTALPCLRDSGKVRKGQHILINGASGAIGTCAVQLAKHYGATVTGVCSTANLALVQSLGADQVIDYTAEDFTDKTQAYDMIFDVAGKSSFARCKKALKQNGTYLTIVSSPAIIFQQMWTSKLGSAKAMLALTGLRPAAERLKDLAFITGLLEAGALKAVIDRFYPLEQIADAHRHLEAGHKRGSVVITVRS